MLTIPSQIYHGMQIDGQGRSRQVPPFIPCCHGCWSVLSALTTRRELTRCSQQPTPPSPLRRFPPASFTPILTLAIFSSALILNMPASRK